MTPGAALDLEIAEKVMRWVQHARNTALALIGAFAIATGIFYGFLWLCTHVRVS